MFVCKNSNQTCFSDTLTSAGPLSGSGFNTSLRAQQMLMHRKSCLIPIIICLKDWDELATVWSDCSFRSRAVWSDSTQHRLYWWNIQGHYGIFVCSLFHDMIQLMRLWHFSSSVNSFFKRASGAKCLIFGQTLRLLPYFMCANSKGSGETAWMCRLAWGLRWLPMW